MFRKLAIDLLVPTGIYYGSRALGADQTTALVLSGVIPALRVIYSVITERRISGVNAFVLGAVVLGFAMSFVTGEPRVLLVRAAWGTAAFGVVMLASLFFKRPLLHSMAMLVLPEDKKQVWTENWEKYPAIRHALRGCTAIWGVIFLADTAIRVGMALTLPIDLVPVLDDVLLVVLLVVLVVVQRVYSRMVMHRAGLRINGVHVSRA
ncbi:VC0807 family protein [Lentzea sp. NPDC005914]|uniref:VC0807 family protein n=1 Tax=Lentzea sp. NPDC005914 TaxID=3154572 RepID=UPI0033CC446B